MRLTAYQNAFVAGEWSPTLHTRFDHEKYAAACKTVKNWILHDHGGASTRPGTQYVGETKSSGAAYFVPFEFSVTQAYMLEFGNLYMRVIMDGAYVDDGGSPYEIVTTWAIADVPYLDVAQSADTMFIVHPGYPPRKLTRSAHDSWSLVDAVFKPGTGLTPTNPSCDTGTDNNYVVTAVMDDGEEGLPTAAEEGGDACVFSWTGVSDAIRYRIYKDENKAVGLYGFVAEIGSTKTSWTDASVTPDYENLPPEDPGLFGSANNYPGAVEFHGQRLVYARTNNAPHAFWGSQVGRPENFCKHFPAQADDAYEWTLNATKMNAVEWMVPVKNLIFGTAGGQFIATPDPTTGITPTSPPLIERHNVWGSARLQPVVIGNSVLFLQYGGKAVWALTYSLDLGYDEEHLSLLSEHLLENHTIVSWAHQSTPHDILWAVRDDGVLLSLTYNRKHKIWGWSRHETSGLFECVGVVPDGTGDDQVYFIVNRTIDGSTVRYVEMLAERLEDGELAKAFCVDCGLTLDNTGSAFSDTFDTERDFKTGGDGSKGNGWYADNTANMISATSQTDTAGELEIETAAGKGWITDDFRDGPLCYQVVSGGFAVTTKVRVGTTGHLDGGGIVIQSTTDPDDFIYVSYHNYTTGSGAYRRMWGSVVNDTSEHIYWDLPSSSDVDEITLRVVRVADTFKLYTSRDDGETWELLATYDRSDFSADANVGLGTTANISTSSVINFEYFEYKVTSSEVSGLDHLEGETIVGLSDGFVETGLVVTSGAVTLTHPGEYITLGLGYTCDLETLDMIFGTRGGVINSRERQIRSVVLNLTNTRALQVGPDEDNLYDIEFRYDEDWDEATGLYTGEKEALFEPVSDRQTRAFLRVETPEPATVAAIFPDVLVEE